MRDLAYTSRYVRHSWKLSSASIVPFKLLKKKKQFIPKCWKIFDTWGALQTSIVFSLVTCYCDLLTLDIWPHDWGSPLCSLFLYGHSLKSNTQERPRWWRESLDVLWCVCAIGRQTRRLIVGWLLRADLRVKKTLFDKWWTRGLAPQSGRWTSLNSLWWEVKKSAILCASFGSQTQLYKHFADEEEYFTADSLDHKQTDSRW